MITRQSVVAVLGLFVFTCHVSPVQSAPPFRFDWEESEERLAGTTWTDGFGYEQPCAFDFRVDSTGKANGHFLDDREIWNVQVQDTYTNLVTGFSFEDFASWTIEYDFQKGLKILHGLFWRIRAPGDGMVLLDVGGFAMKLPDLSFLPESFVGNNHDVNGPMSEGNLPAVSYCDLMAEIFPD